MRLPLALKLYSLLPAVPSTDEANAGKGRRRELGVQGGATDFAVDHHHLRGRGSILPPQTYSKEVTKRLNDCLQPKIHLGNYVSDDDGKSAETLLNQCPAQVDRWTTWCQRYSGDDRTTCAVKVIFLAQTAIKDFDK
jgi:hypothetical protein